MEPLSDDELKAKTDEFRGIIEERTSELKTEIEELKEQGKTIDLDRRVIDAYIEFLKTGGTTDGLSPGAIAPGDYVLLLPEIIEDVKRLLDITEAKGIEHMESIEALKAAFAKRDMDRERSDWLYAYNPLTVALPEV